MTQPPPPDPAAPGLPGTAPVCPRHPGEVSYVSCQRCERPVCPACQRPASVGVQCVDCVERDRASAPVMRSVFGGRAVEGRPVVTTALIAICVLVYLGQLADSRVTEAMAYAPSLGASEPWRFLSAAFVHSPGSLMHILFNMYALWICGQYLEPLLGRARFLALYLLSALGGSVGFLAFAALTDPSRPASAWWSSTVGASGAVFGLFVAVVVLNRRLGRETRSIVVMIAINAALPLIVPNIAWQAHLGGAVTGGVVAAAVAALGRRRSSAQWPALAGVLVLLVALAVVLSLTGDAAAGRMTTPVL